MKMKLRIIKEDGVFYVQEKGWFLWDYHRYLPYGIKPQTIDEYFDSMCAMTFITAQDAKDHIDDYRESIRKKNESKVAKRKPKIEVIAEFKY